MIEIERAARSTLPNAMRAMRALCALATMTFALGSAGCGASGPKYTVAPIDSTKIPNAQQYLNPVIDADFPDPTVLRASDNSYYAYATQTTGYRIQASRSANLVAWTSLGEALPSVPSWASQSQNFWAPDVHERAGQFVMYYAAQIDATQRIHPNDGFCIGMATAATGAGPFTDIGAPVVCGPGFSTIDPMGFDDPQSGKHYLYWGSSGAPIVVRELAADRHTFADTGAIALVTPRTSGGGYDTGLIEGPWVTYHAPYYYLFYSGNNCCGSGAHYAVMVARASSPTGPFTVLTDAGGTTATPILQANSRWNGPGHNSVVTDGAGTDWMLYHAIDVNHPYLIAGNTSISRRPMLLDRITWTAGWPTVGDAGTPSTTPQTRPVP